MFNLTTIGINHKNTAIDLREKFFLNATEKELLLAELKNDPAVYGAVVLSTCNRTEIYAHTLSPCPGTLMQLLFQIKKIPYSPELLEKFYVHHGSKAVEHLFCVSSGLDSLVLGEKQILGQVKQAAELSRNKGMMTRELNILTNLAVRAGKKSQNETEIGRGGSSVSWAAVATAQDQLAGSLAGRSILIIGAGKMGHLAAEQLKSKSVGKIFVMNRNCDKAENVADAVHGIAVSFWELKEVLSQVDVCICSAGAPHYLIERDLVANVMPLRQYQKLVLIDISLPRNIDPAVKSVSGVTLYSIDELSHVVQDNTRKRLSAVNAVRDIVTKKTEEFYFKVSKTKLSQSGLLAGLKS